MNNKQNLINDSLLVIKKNNKIKEEIRKDDLFEVKYRIRKYKIIHFKADIQIRLYYTNFQY
jgi:hypothetical protein